MKILLVTPVPPQGRGGGAIPVLLHAQLEGLSAANEVTLVSSIGEEAGEAEAAEQLLGSGVDAHFADRRIPRRATRRWRRRARMAGAWTCGRRPWRPIWFADPGIQAILDDLAGRRAFDIAVTEDSAMAGFRMPAGIPTVLTEHEVLRPRPLQRPPVDPRGWPGWAFEERDWHKRPRFQRHAWRRFDRVLAFGRRDATSIAELAPEVAARVRVSPFGLELPPASPADRVQSGTVLFVGNFTHRPNRDAALWLAGEIMPALRARQPGARLRIVGASPPAEILALATEDIEVIPDAPAVEPHVESAAVVVAPVRTGGGMRMKVLQALGAGKAVVTTPRGIEGFDCFAEDAPLTVARDAVSFAAATADLLGDRTSRTELGLRARSFAQRHYAPDAWAERLIAAYGEVIASARS